MDKVKELKRLIRLRMETDQEDLREAIKDKIKLIVKIMSYSDFINWSVKYGWMPTGTLCPAFEGREEYELFRPTEEEKQQLDAELKCRVAWESDDFTAKGYELTGLRANILIFCDLMSTENELRCVT